MMTTATTTTKARGDFDDNDNSNNDYKDNDNDDARMFHLCHEGGINWVDGGVTKKQSTNLAYVVAFEDNNNSNKNKQWAARPQERSPSGGHESG